MINKARRGIAAAALAVLVIMESAQGIRAEIRPAATPIPPAQLFVETCAGCHGTGAEIGGRAPSLFDQRLLSARTDEQLLDIVRKGVPGTDMPAFDGMLTDHESWRLIAYVRSQGAALKGRPTFVPDPHGQIVDSEKQRFRIEVVARALETPWGLAFLPDGRLLVTERPGRLRIVQADKLLPGAVKGTPEVWARQDGGMLDVALHPDFARNGWIYLSYSEVAPGQQTRQADDASASAASPPSMTVIIRGKLNRRNEWIETEEIFRAPAALYTQSGSHYGSRLAFDREGYLFFSIGDRGEFANAQDLGTPLGKIHRVRDDGTIPADNPFRDRPGAVASIWSYGHRNSQGLAWDPVTGRLWGSEHGPSGGDELNVIEKGKNYGWGVATMGVQPGITARNAPGMEPPIAYYTPRIAPSGIAFYAGSRYPGWKNNLFVAGLAGQQLRRLEIRGREVMRQEPVFEKFGRTRALTNGPDGLLYILLQNPTGAGTGLIVSDSSPGMIVRLVPVD